MKDTYRLAKILNPFLSAIAIVLLTASYASAHGDSSAFGAALVLALVVFIVVLTLAGGGSKVIARLNAIKYPSKTRRALASIMEFIAGVILFFLGVVVVPFFGLIGFSIYAIARGVKMIKWSIDAAKDGVRPAHLEGANPKILKIAGIILIALTLIVFGYSIINFNEVSGIDDSRYRKRGYAAMLNSDAKNAYDAAKAYLEANPKAQSVTCADMERAGYEPSYRDKITCFSDMTASSGSIKITGPESWGLKKPSAIITYTGELDPAKVN